jgi:hypothetical protein
MIIVAIIVTCNRVDLLPRALRSVANQTRVPDAVFVISNSKEKNFHLEKIICKEFDFNLLKNKRTENYAGGLNTGLEQIIHKFGIKRNIYFASLDDDDEWLPSYLQEISICNDNDYDLIAANLCRISPVENNILVLPQTLSCYDFLSGNPGISGSNTFVRLETLLFAGGFDEGMKSTIDRDIMVRVFQQNPKYKIINKYLVNQHTDNERIRITTDFETKKSGLKTFYYKYNYLMDKEIKYCFFDRAKTLFHIPENEFAITTPNANVLKKEICFKNKGDYQFIIGFIAGEAEVTQRLIGEIIYKKISVDFIIIIDNIKNKKLIDSIEHTMKNNNFAYKIILEDEWKTNLDNGFYGEYFKRFNNINSIPLGRTILQYHLYNDTMDFDKPVYWILDDDMSLSSITNNLEDINFFDIINSCINESDALIGSISNDAPVPPLSCMRGQLIDFMYSNYAKNTQNCVFNDINSKPEYYYDLSDAHTDHLEIPIYHKNANKQNLKLIFMGKSISRKVLQHNIHREKKMVSRRGGNTIIFNKELLLKYPVVNITINNNFARRGDLLWCLLSQINNNYAIYEHTFALNHDRQVSEFNLDKELEKVAYDIVGHAFCKATSEILQRLKQQNIVLHTANTLELLANKTNNTYFMKKFKLFIEKRKIKFLMNYYRIIGISKILSADFQVAREFYENISNVESNIQNFHKIIQNSLDKKNIVSFFDDMAKIIRERKLEQSHMLAISKQFNLKERLRKLGCGKEGYVFTDNIFAYKSFFNISDKNWNFIKTVSKCFCKHNFFENIEIIQNDEHKFIFYPYRKHSNLKTIVPSEIVSFLKFCKENNFVFTNIAPKNFITIDSGKTKLIDYGNSFECYSEEKLLNSTKRAYLLYKHPKMNNETFQRLTQEINNNQIPQEIEGWQLFWYAVSPRKKEDILDIKILEIIKPMNPEFVLDYGAGKCKTSSLIKTKTGSNVYVYDIDLSAIKKYGQSFAQYIPNDRQFDNKFDVVLINIVLCVVDNAAAEEILYNANKAIRKKGKIIISICNPDFANVNKSEFQDRGFVPTDISKEQIITKTCACTGVIIKEYHRPTEKYMEMFSESGFSVENIIDTEGVNFNTIEYASDFKIFVLRKLNEKHISPCGEIY